MIHDVDDGSQVAPLLDQVAGSVVSFTGEGAYDRKDVYEDLARRYLGADVAAPPRSCAVPSRTAESAPTQRNRHVQLITKRGRRAWQKASG